MTDLPVQMPEIELPSGVVTYLEQPYLREPVFPESNRLLREPSPRCARRKTPVAAEEPAKETKPYPFRKDLLWKTVTEDVPEEFLRFFFPAIASGKAPRQKIEFLNKELLQLFPPEDDKFAPRRGGYAVEDPYAGRKCRGHPHRQGPGISSGALPGRRGSGG